MTRATWQFLVPLSIGNARAAKPFDRSPRRKLHASASIAAALLASVSCPSPAANDSPSAPFPGLELVTSKSVDRLYRRPDVDTSGYNKILIREPLIEFSKAWNPRNFGTFGLSATQLKGIRVELADLVKSTFAKVLSDGGYEVVAEAADGVLEITPNVINLYINAPDTRSAGRSRTYAMDAGSMTLALQVNDAVTGTLLAVAYDQQRGGQSATLQWVTSASNRSAASAILKGWAEQLKRDLDASRGK
jgi:Protein of unknown function (DUF3313)